MASINTHNNTKLTTKIYGIDGDKFADISSSYSLIRPRPEMDLHESEKRENDRKLSWYNRHLLLQIVPSVYFPNALCKKGAFIFGPRFSAKASL